MRKVAAQALRAKTTVVVVTSSIGQIGLTPPGTGRLWKVEPESPPWKWKLQLLSLNSYPNSKPCHFSPKLLRRLNIRNEATLLQPHSCLSLLSWVSCEIIRYMNASAHPTAITCIYIVKIYMYLFIL